MNSVNQFAIRKRERFVVMNHHLSPSILVVQAPARVLAPGQSGQCAQSAVAEVHRQKQGLMGRSSRKDASLILVPVQVLKLELLLEVKVEVMVDIAIVEAMVE